MPEGSLWAKDTVVAPVDTLRIALCLPDSGWLDQLSGGDLTEAAVIQQGYIADGLCASGHELTLIAPVNLNQIVYRAGTQQHVAAQTWSAHPAFQFTSKVTWRVQQYLRIPYLNVFSNYRRLDALMHVLPGHDLVYERNSLYNGAVAMACGRLDLPYVMFFDADQLLERDFMGAPITGLLRWRAKQLLRYNLATAARVICVSEQARAHVISAWKVPASRAVVLTNGVDTRRFQPDAVARSEVRASLDVGPRPLVIFVGNFYPWHDVATLLAAFALALRAHPDARLVLVGDGPQRQSMQQLAIDLGVAHAARFTGPVPHAEVPRLLAAADVAVAPVPTMQRDLWLSPMKLFEYMATGLAVVGSKAGQVADVVGDGRSGLLVPPGDAPALAAALARLIEDQALRSRLGRQAREDARQKHSWDERVAALERLFNAVVVERSKVTAR